LEASPDRGFKPVDIPEIAMVANYVLEKIFSSDPDQYNALLKSIGEPERVPSSIMHIAQPYHPDA
jgi:hypothetical protein